MILEQAAYLLGDSELLLEAKADKSVPMAVDWVLNWLTKTGRGKDPDKAMGNTTTFNNAHYYDRNLERPDYEAISRDAIDAAKESDAEDGITRTDAEYKAIGRQAAETAKERDRADRAAPHDQTMAESVVEAVVGEFSHPVDYVHQLTGRGKGWSKMFVLAFTRIALTECDFKTDHPDKQKIEQLKKCYLTATMMWKADKNQFGDDCNMQGITYNKLVAACKPHHREALARWNEEKAQFESEWLRNLAIRELAAAGNDNPTEEEITAAINAIRERTDGDIAAAVEVEETPAEPVNQPYIPKKTDEGPYADLPKPYTDGVFRLGNYNCVLIPNYEASHTWEKFTNRTPSGEHGGGVSWCITYARGHWSMYGCGNSRTVYYCYTDNLRTLNKLDYPDGFSTDENGSELPRRGTANTEWGRSLICIMIDPPTDTASWRFAQATSRYNHGDGRGYNADLERGGDNFINSRGDNEYAAQTIATMFGCTPKEVKAKLVHHTATTNNNNENVDRSDAEAIIERRDFKRRHRGMYIAPMYDQADCTDYIITCRGSKALIINNNWINRIWYKDINFLWSGRNCDYFRVQLGASQYNIVNRQGRYMLPDDVPYVNGNTPAQHRYVDVTLKPDGTTIYHNFVDLKTGKYVFKQPFHLLVCTDYIYHAKQLATDYIPVYMTPDDKFKRYYLITARGKKLGPYNVNENRNTTNIEDLAYNVRYKGLPYEGWPKVNPITKHYIFINNGSDTTVDIKKFSPDGTIGDTVAVAKRRHHPLVSNDGTILYTDDLNKYTILMPDGQIRPINKLFDDRGAVFVYNSTLVAIRTSNNSLDIYDYSELDDDGFCVLKHSLRPDHGVSIDINNTTASVCLETTLMWDYKLKSLATTEDIMPDITISSISSYEGGKDDRIFRGYYKDENNRRQEVVGRYNVKTGEYYTSREAIQDIELEFNRHVVPLMHEGDTYYLYRADYQTRADLLFDAEFNLISNDYKDYTMIGHDLFLARCLNTDSKVILNTDGTRLFDETFDKILSSPDESGIGSVKKGRNTYYFNVQGDFSRSIEPLIESIKSIKQNIITESIKTKRYNNYMFLAAQMC